MQWHEIMPFDDLWIGEMLGVEVGGVKVLLLNVEDEVRAYLDRCPHRASLLSEGNLEGLTLTCATHLWEFNAFCKERMPRHQYSRQVEIVDDLPKSETGEILRGELRAQESAKLRGQS